jgi:hypothetical protein
LALRAEIEEMFAVLEGCADTAQLLAVPGLHVINKQRDWDYAKTPARVAYLREYRRRPSAAAARREYDRQRKLLRSEKRLQTNVEKWAAEIQLILIGREIEGAIEVVKHPITEVEHEAQADFIFFLRRCRNCSVKSVAGMLGITEGEVREALHRRGVA